MIEIWKKSDYDPYQFSNFGRVKNSETDRILKPVPDKQGYLGVNIRCNGKYKRLQVHREIAKLFVEVPDRLKHIPISELEVDHYNEDKSNNRASNLHWVTPKENANRGTRNERSAKARGCKILQLTVNNEFVNEFYSMGQAQKETGIWKTNISACCSGKVSTAGGYKWVKV